MTLDDLVVKEVGSNRIEIDQDDPISRTIGYVGSIRGKLMFLSKDVGSYPKEDVVKGIEDYVRNSGLENVTVRVGHSKILKDTVRLFTDPKLKDISLLGKIFFGISTTVIGGLMAKLTRADYYNPFTRTVHCYSNIEAIAKHELGHAEDFQHNPVTLYSILSSIPPVRLYQEFKASQYAHKKLSPKNKYQTGRYLVPAFASYLCPLVTPILSAISAGYNKIKKAFGFKKYSPAYTT